MSSNNGKGLEPLVRTPRRFSRHAVELPVKIVDATHRTDGRIQFDTSDLSAGGAFLRSSLLFELDEILTLELELGEGKTLRVCSKVVRIAKNDPSGMGIEFVDLAEADREALRAFLKKE